MLQYVSAEVENVKTMFGEREDVLRRERDELAAAVADRDEVEVRPGAISLFALSVLGARPPPPPPPLSPPSNARYHPSTPRPV